MFTVTLKKGRKGSHVWKHVQRALAIRRADALADLHTTTVVDDGAGNYVIDASRFYNAQRAP